MNFLEGQTAMNLRFTSLKMICVTALLLSFGEVGLGETLNDTIHRMQIATTPSEFAKHCSDSFNQATTEELRLLVARAECDVALAAGWERVRRTVPNGRQQTNVKPNPEALSRFVGLVEGRTQVPLPRLWEAAVESTDSSGRNHISFSVHEKTNELENLNAGELMTVNGCTIEGERNSRIIRMMNKTLSLPVDAMVTGDQVTAGSLNNKAYVALYAFPPYPFSLFAIDQKMDNAIWSTRVWGAGDLMSYTGFGWHEVELRARGTSLFVFGCSGNVIYIESFDTTTGKNLWRFSSTYFDSQLK